MATDELILKLEFALRAVHFRLATQALNAQDYSEGTMWALAEGMKALRAVEGR